MTTTILKYADVFSSGMRIEVELPLSEEKRFRDEATVIFIHQDLLVLQFTRELLPESVVLKTGTQIHLRTGNKGKGYRCQGMLLRHDSHSRFRIRLTGDPIPFNDREFFRIDVFIPLAYRPKGHGRWTLQEAEPESPFAEDQADTTMADLGATPKHPLPVAANLSGAGVRISIPERFEIDALLDLILYLPYGKTSTMSLVGQVVHVEEVSRAGDPHPMFGTALHFVDLDDTQRETLIGFIQRVQLKQIHWLREQQPEQGAPAMAEAKPLLTKKNALMLFWTVLLTLLFVGLVISLDNYRRNRPKGEIERTFEEQIQKIMEKKGP